MTNLQAEADAILDGTLTHRQAYEARGAKPKKAPAPPVGADALVGKKTRPATEPWLIFRDPRSGWTWKVLKRYGKPDVDFARWFLATSSPMTYGGDELGDGYVRDVVLYGRLSQVDGRAPTDAERADIDALVRFHATRPDPLKAMGF